MTIDSKIIVSNHNDFLYYEILLSKVSEVENEFEETTSILFLKLH